MRICIFLEQYLLPKRYKENIERFIYSLKKYYEITIFSPDIDMNFRYEINNNNIKYIHIKDCKTINSETYTNIETFNILIIFSDYNNRICFDRRPLIINSIKSNKIIMIPTHNILSYNILNDHKLLYITNSFSKKLISKFSYNCNSIFDNLSYDDNTINLFYKKYNLNKNNKIIAFIPGPLVLWYLDNYIYDIDFNKNILIGKIFLQNLENIKKEMKNENYDLIGIRHYDDIIDNYNPINIMWIDDEDYNILKYICSGIITIANIDLFKYINLNKPIIEVANIPLKYYFNKNKNNYKEINKYFYNEIISNESIFISKDNIPYICKYMNSLIKNKKIIKQDIKYNNFNSIINFIHFKIFGLEIEYLIPDSKRIPSPISASYPIRIPFTF